ncbi:MAG TPA: 1-acyl-sn-glycerol-3-phosphate acyltransferase [Polyangiaceae bacterium LLY-WYZ-15_(1-7)]|nr:1-acyl-sn-glycerol-3-phosphate acyltransferase [Polyangiaceae bacterium LLY-WYZ-15_(1-7)]
MPWLYRVARRVFRRAVDFYFLDVQVAGAENVPREGAVLFAANHPNSILDTLVLGSQVPRPIHFLARSGLFANPAVGFLLRGAGAIPVYRRQDGPARPGGNEDAFAAAWEVLGEGDVIGIFPEGRNAPVRHVRDIKTGVARIALGAEAAGAAAGVKVVPVGLNYEERDRFLTRVLVRFGKPIAAAEWAEAHAEDPRAAARAMTERIQEAMREQAVHVHDEERTQLLHDVDALVGEELQAELVGQVDLRTFDEKLLQRVTGRGEEREDLDGRFKVRQWIADAIAWFEREEPETLRRLERGIDRYSDHLAQLRLRADFAERPARTVSKRRAAIGLSLYAALLAPVAVWGLAHNFVPYRVTRRYALGAPEEAIRGIRAVVGGAGFFGLAYALYGSAVWAGTGSWVALTLYLMSLPIAGVWFLRYAQRLAKYADRILLRTLFQTRRRLLRRLLIEREQLLVQIDAMKRTYLEHVRGGATGGGERAEAGRAPAGAARPRRIRRSSACR